MTAYTRDNLVDGGIVLVSVFFLMWVIPTFTPPYPGYGVSSRLLPNVVISLILALAALSMIGNLVLRRKAKQLAAETNQPSEEKEISQESKVYLGHLASFMLPSILLFPALKYLTFIPGGILFLLIMQYLCGQRKPLSMAIVAVCTTGVIYAALVYGLGVPLP